MFTKRLISLRQKAGMSQQEISKRLGIARTTYASYEQGAREPDIELINKISDFHGVSTDWLLGKDKKESAYALPESEYDRIIKEAESYYKVNLRDDPVVLDAMKQLIDSLAKMKQGK